MATYFISYDLHHEDEHDYKALYKALETHNAIRVLESVWCLKAANTDASEIRDIIRRHLHKRDSILVVKAAGWISNHLLDSPKNI